MNDDTLRTTYPHVAPAWADVLVLELRLRDVPGARIGEALAEVEEFCAESGESAAEAFGDPRAYAARLDDPARSHAHVPGELLAVLGVELAGSVLLGWALGPALAGEPVRLSVGSLAAAILLAAVALVVVRRLDVLVRSNPLLGGLGFVAFVTASGALLAWSGPVVADLPAVPVALAGLVALWGSALWGTVRGVLGDEDLVVAPGAQPSAAERRGARRFGLVGLWMMPVLVPVVDLLGWALAH